MKDEPQAGPSSMFPSPGRQRGLSCGVRADMGRPRPDVVQHFSNAAVTLCRRAIDSFLVTWTLSFCHPGPGGQRCILCFLILHRKDERSTGILQSLFSTEQVPRFTLAYPLGRGWKSENVLHRPPRGCQARARRSHGDFEKVSLDGAGRQRWLLPAALSHTGRRRWRVGGQPCRVMVWLYASTPQTGGIAAMHRTDISGWTNSMTISSRSPPPRYLMLEKPSGPSFFFPFC